LSNEIFQNIDYDLLAIGNHELYVSEIAYEHFNKFAKYYGEKYVTSNVDIWNPSTMSFQSIGSKYRYFKTPSGTHALKLARLILTPNLMIGIRIMAFGVIFNFAGHSNASRITRASERVKEKWFMDAVNYPDPIDLFLVIGHNPPRTTSPSSTVRYVYEAIRQMKPEAPIQIFGGHSHVRDFVIYDQKATGLQAGMFYTRYGKIHY
jgi:2',3'-cyclic-nucleotide 2'-phosphodiesterase (5'-nucleotidase family)